MILLAEFGLEARLLLRNLVSLQDIHSNIFEFETKLLLGQFGFAVRAGGVWFSNTFIEKSLENKLCQELKSPPFRVGTNILEYIWIVLICVTTRNRGVHMFI